MLMDEVLLDKHFISRLDHTILTDDLGITTVVAGNGKAFLDVNATSVAAAWLPLWGLPTLAGCVHDAAGVVMGAAGQALLQPLAEHLAGVHAWVPLPHNEKLGLEFTHISLLFRSLQAVARGHLADLQELLAGLKIGDGGRCVAQPDHLVEALHAQVGARSLDEGVELEGPDLAGDAGLGRLGYLHVDAVAAGIGVLQGPGARSGRQSCSGGKHPKEAILLQGGAGGRGWARGGARGQAEEKQ